MLLNRLCHFYVLKLIFASAPKCPTDERERESRITISMPRDFYTITDDGLPRTYAVLIF
jgi:hypothetical protein